jgi:regulator of protease activity HflC (stomatin/prohibitin superfamily)
LLAKHNLSSPDELAEYIDGLSAKAGKIGNLDPEELVKSHETLTAYHKEWAKQERDKMKAAEKPEETIARLEKELQAEERRKARAEGESKKVESAKAALATWDNAVTSTIASDPNIPPEYHDFFKSFMGVNNPINAADPSDRAKAVKLTKEYGIPAMRKFEQAVIARYRAGKIEIPAVPPPAAGDPPVTGATAPKNQSERRALAHTLFSRILGK